MIYFISSIPGVINYFISLCSENQEEFKFVSSDEGIQYFNKLGIQNVEQYEQIRNHINGLVVTGSYWRNTLDIESLLYFKEKGIKVISVIDHWSFYKERFTYGNQLVEPDWIIVNDLVAKKQAEKAGLSPEKIIPLGNPVLDRLTKFPVKTNKENFLKFRKNFKEVIGFVSENFSSDFSLNSDFYEGFDEFDVLRQIVFTKQDYQVVFIKLHPTEDGQKYNEFLQRNDVVLYDEKESLIKYSDFVIGMGSFLLIEASIIRTDVISYRPNEKVSFIGNDLGVTYLCKTPKLLKTILLHEEKIKSRDLKTLYSGSIERIWNFLGNHKK